jgi:parallel beta-helix repeat protein
MMTSFYVSPYGSDSNPGTSEAPFATILHASRAATPDTTVHVAAGTYEGGFQTLADNVTYVSDTPLGAKIVPPAYSHSDTAWDNRGAGVTISGFEVDGSHTQGGTPWRVGIYTAGSNSTISDSHVHDIATDVGQSSYGGAGIQGDGYYGGSNFTLSGNIVDHIGSGGDPYLQGIYESAPGTITNNVVHDVSGWGIHLWHDATEVAVENNTVYNNGAGGIVVGAGDWYHGAAPDDYTTVANNIVFGNPAGIFENGWTGTNNSYTSNLVYDNDTDWALHNGLTPTDPVDLQSPLVALVGSTLDTPELHY